MRSLIAAAFAIAEPELLTVETVSSAATVPRTLTAAVAPAFRMVTAPVVSAVALTATVLS